MHTLAATNPLFYGVFGIFLIAVVALIAFTLRFTLQRDSEDRQAWKEEHALLPDDQGGDDEVEEEEPEEKTALVLAGGGTRGAVQVGMLQVLAEHGFVPDVVYGSSVGAINGVSFAGNPTPAGVATMAEVWQSLTRDTIYPQGRLHGPWMYVTQRPGVYANSGLRDVLSGSLPFARLEETRIPVEVVATSLADGREHWFTSGSAVDAILASTAIPAIYPPVEIDGASFIDGGVVNNVPLARAIEAGATRVVVLLCSSPTYVPPMAKRPVEAMVHAFLVSIHARFARDMASVPEDVEVILCIGGDDVPSDFDDFSHTDALIAAGRREAEAVVRRYGLGSSLAGDTQPSSGS